MTTAMAVTRSACYNVHIVTDGVQAMEAAATFDPDVVILDLRMPGVDGFTAAQELLRQPSSKDATFIAYTGLTSAEVMQRCKNVGFHHFVRKPADVDEFERLLADIAAQRRSGTALQTPSS